MKFHTRAPFLLAGLIVAMLLLSLYSLTSYREQLGGSLRQKVMSDMEKANAQSVLLFNNMLSDYFTQLETVSLFCASNADVHPEEIVRLVKSYNEGNQYARLGLVGLDGIVYAGDGVIWDVSGRKYFQRAARGEKVISDVHVSDETVAEVIVLAEPVRKDGEIIAVVCGRYDVETFTHLMGSSQFEGNGATMVIQKDGRVVSSYEGLENFSTFYEALEQMDFSGSDTLESLKRRIQNDERGFFAYSKNGKDRYIYFSPTGYHDYTMVSLALAEPMEEQLHSISEQAYLLVLKNVLIYSVILACCWGIFISVRQLIKINLRDPLTRVYNKAGAHAAVERILRHPDCGSHHACLFIDLDNFKSVNDCYGHEAGDKLLQDVTEILADSFRKTDIVGRFGGDEFIVWMNGAPMDSAVKKAGALCESLRNVGGIPVSASIGIAGFPEHGKSYAEILHHADEALYQAKKAGKNMYSIYFAENEEDAL